MPTVEFALAEQILAERWRAIVLTVVRSGSFVETSFQEARLTNQSGNGRFSEKVPSMGTECAGINRFEIENERVLRR